MEMTASLNCEVTRLVNMLFVLFFTLTRKIRVLWTLLLDNLGDQRKLRFCNKSVTKTLYSMCVLVRSKCTVKCFLDELGTDALWDTGAQVSIISHSGFIKQCLAGCDFQDITKLLCMDGLDLRAANGTADLGKGTVCIRAKWPIRPELIPVSVAWSN